MIRRFGQFLMLMPLFGLVTWFVLQVCFAWVLAQGYETESMLFFLTFFAQKWILVSGIVFFLLGSLFFVFGSSYKEIKLDYVMHHVWSILREVFSTVLAFVFLLALAVLVFSYAGVVGLNVWLVLILRGLSLFLFSAVFFSLMQFLLLRVKHLGEKPISFSFSSYLHVVVSVFFVFLLSLLGFILGVVPGIIFLVRSSFVPFVALEHPHLSLIEIIRHSRKMSSGLFRDLFALWSLFLFAHFIGMIFLFVGLLWTLPLHIMTLAYMYHQISLRSSS